jgi:hypothetical protein
MLSLPLPRIMCVCTNRIYYGGSVSWAPLFTYSTYLLFNVSVLIGSTSINNYRSFWWRFR